MNITDKHPRWAGLVLSLFFPGAGQYLAGAKRRAVIWFVVLFLGQGLVFWLLSEPAVSGLATAAAALGVWLVLWVWMLIDARQPIPKMDALNWSALVLCGTGILILEKSFWNRFCADVFATPNNCMAPTLQVSRGADGKVARERFVVQKCAYWLNEPSRGDIVVFRADGLSLPLRKGFLAFRIAALPGERVSISQGRLTINGQPVAAPAMFSKIRYVPAEDALLLNSPQASFVVPPKHYFLMGDNSSESFDSRYWGPVPRSQIVGRVTRVCWPLARAATFP